MDVLDGGPVESLVGFFDVQFRGSPENPTDSQVRPSHSHAMLKEYNKSSSPAWVHLYNLHLKACAEGSSAAPCETELGRPLNLYPKS